MCARPILRTTAFGSAGLVLALLAPPAGGSAPEVGAAVPASTAAASAPPTSASAAPETAESGTAESGSPDVHFTGLTFVGTRGDARDVVVRSRRGVFFPGRDEADLEDVTAVVSESDGSDGFTMSCDRASLDVATRDFHASGHVVGTTARGQHYSAPYVVYDHAAGVLHSDAPVSMRDAVGTFHGDGFRYDVKRRAFTLLGNVTVEQKP